MLTSKTIPHNAPCSTNKTVSVRKTDPTLLRSRLKKHCNPQFWRRIQIKRIKREYKQFSNLCVFFWKYRSIKLLSLVILLNCNSFWFGPSLNKTQIFCPVIHFEMQLSPKLFLFPEKIKITLKFIKTLLFPVSGNLETIKTVRKLFSQPAKHILFCHHCVLQHVSSLSPLHQNGIHVAEQRPTDSIHINYVTRTSI